jgi:hypothetical protein
VVAGGVDVDDDDDDGLAAAVATVAAVGFASDLGAAGPCPREAAWEAAWEAQLARLAAYKAAHGDCNVPMSWAEDPRLATWVNNQRPRKRQLDRGEPSEGMTAARAAWLTALGFAWAPPRCRSGAARR